MTLLIKNIKELLQIRNQAISFVKGEEMKQLPSIKNAYLIIENEFIKDFGWMENCPDLFFDKIIDADGKTVLPTWCDAHTHIVYAGNRVQEFVDKINGLSYEEIAKRGGGILNSAEKLNETSAEDLYQESSKRLEELMQLGTGAVEIKSGYGLSVDGELKMLRVIKRLKDHYPTAIKATFLGAHA
ncbi:MAG: imidazolonepropionase, partial [Flavobacteriaceae bacterium]|nr:imidazolonepropionase [Flavobacteriaceae bacterium]